MKELNYIQISTIDRLVLVERPNWVIGKDLMKKALDILGYNTNDYILTTLPEWKKQQKDLLRKLGIHPSMQKFFQLEKALDKLLHDYPKDIMVIEWYERRDKRYYGLIIRKSFEVSGIWSKL